MEYQEIEIANEFGESSKHIIINNGDGSFKSFPADPANPEYAAFLKALDDNSEAE
jgi:hypothetical protein